MRVTRKRYTVNGHQELVFHALSPKQIVTSPLLAREGDWRVHQGRISRKEVQMALTAQLIMC